MVVSESVVSEPGGKVYVSIRDDLLKLEAADGDGHPPGKPLVEPGYRPVFLEFRLARFAGNNKMVAGEA